MSEISTPKTGLFAFFGKRSHPSTNSSCEGTVSQVTKSSKISMDEVRKDLSSALEEEDDSNCANPILEGFSDKMEHFEKKMETFMNDFKKEMLEFVHNTMKDMSRKVTTLERKLEQCEKKLKENEEKHSKELQILKTEQNRQAQYSRKGNLRIFGIEEKTNEDCVSVLTEMITKRVGVEIKRADFAAAHRLPKSDRQQHRPIIIRMNDSFKRQEILVNRKRVQKSPYPKI